MCSILAHPFRRSAPNITMISKNALVIGVRTKIDF
jgi:hypothetical protein